MVVSQRDATCARATRMVNGERGRQAGRADSSDRQRPSCMLLEHVQCSIQRQTQTTTKSCVGGAAITCYTADCFGSGARVERPSQFRLAERNWNDWYRISVCVECGRCCPPLIVAAGLLKGVIIEREYAAVNMYSSMSFRPSDLQSDTHSARYLTRLSNHCPLFMVVHCGPSCGHKE